MLDTLTQLGLFFKYSPKRSRRLEEAVTKANSTRPKSEQISKSKFHVFCETRWVEKQTTLRDFSSMYEPIVECLEAIGQLESGWDTKAVTDAYGLLKKITDSTFIVCFQTVLHMFGYVIGISSKLQGTSLDIIQAYEMVTHVKTSVSEARNADYKDVYTKASTMAQKAGLDSLQMPRRCGRQTQRSNVPADNVEQYYERAVFLPFVDSMSQQPNLRFNTMTQQACLAFCLLPNNIASATQESMLALLDFYRDDMPQPDMFAQEVQLWKQTWRNTENKPSTIVETLTETCQHMYPNISKVLTLLLLTSVTSAGVERSNSSLKFIKNPHRSTMGQSRFNALMLLFIHRDIKLDIEEIVNIYARKYPRRMLLIDPLCE
ncbi:52 kDa repressor of the inhibitor of the protein kinase-like [Mya arenaria]|uniref:52 kDa repressor of the inhibitor of the protein kinase-like n=1 Tax=Mya arenaria TaxID=6604 RepID=UPI0022E873ED|nr:52 kDa repressor of the inhibitor of the protein kinase-like [Mya arenaria]